MKKVLIMLVVIVASATSTFAMNPAKTELFNKLNNERVFSGLMKYLDTNSEQEKDLKFVFESTKTKIKNAEMKNDEKAYDNAIIFNLANARYLLSTAQYRKYLTVLNLSLSNDNTDDLYFVEK
ncbi:conserved exported hypothetical protein [uncultured Paludibacter sp.]|uniref:Uncharacterized protein n=1 Tax=uncultured Paludibacter sp. TaxID=497635 RepID=A0A653AFP3_9BACT|nr:conserved exported hypothetical protein [uncultured Paludibacter sp.]